jgi:signal transduction histidine kinase
MPGPNGPSTGTEIAMRWWRRASVQIRSAIAATVVLIVLVAFASAALVFLLQRSLVQGIDQTGTARAAGIAAQVRMQKDGDLTDQSDLARAITAEAARRSWVQVINSRGQVVKNSSDIDGDPALADLHPQPGELLRVDKNLPFDEDRYRVIARGGMSNGHRFTVLVGQSLGPVETSTKTVLSLLAAGIPVLVVVLAAAAFVFAGRSLRPVEAIRRTVASINERDLSERVAVPLADDAVSRLALTMNAMLDRLEVAQRTQRQFVADASHELRSPIATLAATAEINLAHPDADDAGAFPIAVLEESRRLERLVQDMLMLARADERGLHPAGDDVDLDDILDAERQRVNAISELQVAVRISPTRVAGDLHQLRQVVRNLVDNAVQHARSRIEFSVVSQGGKAVLEVFDDGPGVAVADRQRIFDRFVRLEESRDRASGGSGLGLAIVREIVVAHHGTVEVVDDPAGARFRLTLPTA